MGEDEFGLCYADISTAQMYATSLHSGDTVSELKNALGSVSPREVILNLNRSKMPEIEDFITNRLAAMISDGQAGRFELELAKDAVLTQFPTYADEDLLSDKPLVRAVGALVDYIKEMQKTDASYIKELHVYNNGQFLEMEK